MKIVKHSFYNIVGLGLPLVAAIFSIPYLVANLGDSRFGLLTLVWAVTSYFGLFDLGLGRALTHQLSKLISLDKQKEIAPTIFTALIILAMLGIFGAVLMAIFALIGVQYLKDVKDVNEIRGPYIGWQLLCLRLP